MFGQITQGRGFRQCLFRGKEKVSVEKAAHLHRAQRAQAIWVRFTWDWAGRSCGARHQQAEVGTRPVVTCDRLRWPA